MKLTAGTISHPATNSAHISDLPNGLEISHTTSGIARHCQKSRASMRHDTSTYVLRSISCGRTRVQTRLNAGRAMTECDTPNARSSAKLMAKAGPGDADTGASMLLGTSTLAVN